MARPRTPTKVLEMRGGFDKHPERRRAREHEPEITEPIGPWPDCLDEAERARWDELVSWCPWLNVSHRVILEQTCRLWMLDRRGKANPPQQKLLQSNLTQLGMTPVTQSKVVMAKAKQGSKLDRFVG